MAAPEVPPTKPAASPSGTEVPDPDPDFGAACCCCRCCAFLSAGTWILDPEASPAGLPGPLPFVSGPRPAAAWQAGWGGKGGAGAGVGVRAWDAARPAWIQDPGTRRGADALPGLDSFGETGWAGAEGEGEAAGEALAASEPAAVAKSVAVAACEAVAVRCA